MKAQFVRKTPNQTYFLKLRWVIGCLLTLIGVFAYSIAYSAYVHPNTAVSPTTAYASTIPSESSLNIELLISRFRIETGTELKEQMFTTKSLPQHFLPEGALLASEKNLLHKKYAAVMIPPNGYVSREFITSDRPRDSLNIPSGYRALSIEINTRTGVEGYAKPDSRVDVLWLLRDRNGQSRILTIVRFVRVLSVGGYTESVGYAPVEGDTTTATLLLTERQAKMVELAQANGPLSLVLVGDQEPPDLEYHPDEISFADLTQPKEEEREAGQPAPQGTCTLTDPETLEEIQYLLNKNSWQRDTESMEASDDSEEEEKLKKRRWLEQQVPGYKAAQG